MAHVRKGQLTASGEWRKHLRFWKRFFWKAERREARRQAREEARARPQRRAFDWGVGARRFAPKPPYACSSHFRYFMSGFAFLRIARPSGVSSKSTLVPTTVVERPRMKSSNALGNARASNFMRKRNPTSPSIYTFRSSNFV